jgi:hypothetical protein
MRAYWLSVGWAGQGRAYQRRPVSSGASQDGIEIAPWWTEEQGDACCGHRRHEARADQRRPAWCRRIGRNHLPPHGRAQNGQEWKQDTWYLKPEVDQIVPQHRRHGGAESRFRLVATSPLRDKAHGQHHRTGQQQSTGDPRLDQQTQGLILDELVPGRGRQGLVRRIDARKRAKPNPQRMRGHQLQRVQRETK